MAAKSYWDIVQLRRNRNYIKKAWMEAKITLKHPGGRLMNKKKRSSPKNLGNSLFSSLENNKKEESFSVCEVVEKRKDMMDETDDGEKMMGIIPMVPVLLIPTIPLSLSFLLRFSRASNR